ncbi:MAG: J domain-containing protein [Candidatus Pacebacteria bacterium]|nr:J domain-containing protein [Candidatus Paceibacterota bacterium]
MVRSSSIFAKKPLEAERLRACDHSGCRGQGEFRAPKSRDAINDFHWFCLDHVRAYNRSWDFYRGMDYEQIEAEIREDTVWHRPTWGMGENRNPSAAGAGAGHSASAGAGAKGDWTDQIDDPFDLFNLGEARRRKAEQQDRARGKAPFGPAERRAAELFEVTPPLALREVKLKYKALVKAHHPDANGGDKAAEETLKTIIEAYRLLRPHCQSD